MGTKTNIIRFFFFLAIVFAFSLIYKYDGSTNFRKPAQADATNVPVAKTPLQVMQTCLACHDNPQTGAPSIPFTDKLSIGPWVDKIKARTSDANNPMPPNGLLSDQDRATLIDYLTSASKN